MLAYHVERDIPGLHPDFKTRLVVTQCASFTFGPDIARGGTIEMVYRRPDGTVIDTFAINQADCSAPPLKAAPSMSTLQAIVARAGC